MYLVADLHIHTIASGHAYSTVIENVAAAAAKKLQMIAITDHGPAMPGGAHSYHFGNLSVLPERISGVRVLKGVEANIMDDTGRLDLEEIRLARLDIVLAGLHTFCAPNGTVEENTFMLINAMRNPYVDVIVHPGNPEYSIIEEEVVKAAAAFDVALEINNSSLTVSRQGSQRNCLNIATLAKKHNVKILIGSDSHFAASVGEFGAVRELLAQLNFPEELVLNTRTGKILQHLQRRNNRKQR